MAKAEPGESIFTSSGTFTMPKGVKEIEVFAVGGGASGNVGQNHYDRWLSSGAGGGGGYTITSKLDCSNMNTVNVIVGSGSNDTIVESITAKAGSGANGGSGGGGKLSFDYYNGSTSIVPGAGGSDGSNGGSGLQPGTGQGSTTRAFEESDGTLYAGGGGGGWGMYDCQGASGGDGGGGRGCSWSDGEVWSGSANTGGGGGGAGGYANGRSGSAKGGKGGSGIVVIRNARD